MGEEYRDIPPSSERKLSKSSVVDDLLPACSPFPARQRMGEVTVIDCKRVHFYSQLEARIMRFLLHETFQIIFVIPYFSS